MKKSAIALLFSILFVAPEAWSWWSVPANFSGSTHYRITKSAEGLIDSSNYPDVVAKFGTDISNWTSGTSDDAAAHGGTAIPNGGRIDIWWARAQEEYQAFNFNSGDRSAYYFVANMMHLIEDQGVPAHAFNIKHGGVGYMDNMEQLVNYTYSPASVGINPTSDPIANYDVGNFDTLDLTSDSYWRAYWKTSPPYHIHVGGAQYDFNGVYGGPTNSVPDQYDPNLYLPLDVFPSFSWTAGTAEQTLATYVTGVAISNTAGALMAVSESLPPLTRNLAIAGASSGIPVVDTEQGSSITFNLYENRQPDVYIVATVDSADGSVIFAEVRELGSGTQLPYEESYAATWNGKLADGSSLSAGQHTLFVQVWDHDGNPSPVYTMDFKINTPPQVSSTTPANGASGVPTSTTILITFTNDMDQGTASGGISFSPSISGSSMSWTNSRTLSISSTLTSSTNYTVTVHDSMKDTNGSRLDGDKDGHEGGNYVFSFSTASPPKVVSTDPANLATGVALTKTITVTFDQAIDPATANDSTITVDPSVSGLTVNAGGSGVTLNHQGQFEPNTVYTVTVSDSVKSALGIQLDGDGDGNAGGSYTFAFTTANENYNITSFSGDYFDGSQYWVKSGSKSFTVEVIDDSGNAVTTSTPPQITCSGGAVSFSGSGPSSSWSGSVSVSGGDGPATFSTTNGASLSGITQFMIDTKPPRLQSAGGADSPSCNCPNSGIAFNFYAEDDGSGLADVEPAGLGLFASGCYAPGDYEYGASLLKDNVGNTTESTGTLSVSEPPGCDNPDDNSSVSGSSSLTIGNNDFANGIPTLNSGFFFSFDKEMRKVNRTTWSISDGTFAGLIGTENVHVIPSGGLYGKDNSPLFKAELDEFVKQGGTLVVLDQQHGYEFSALPVPQEADGTYKKVAGYGWGEDQSCQYASSYIDTWHQMLAGQSSATPSVNVDGYFTSYPSNATVVLRRVINGQPALISYPYGKGLVVVTTLYSDYAYGFGQASAEEKALVRDLVSWARKPAELPEISSGATLTTPLLVTVKNDQLTEAAAVKVRVLNPDKSTVLAEQTTSLSISAGQTADVSVPFSVPVTTLGIYHTDYLLLDAKGNTLQPQREADSGRFVVSKRPTNQYKSPDFSFSVQSDAEQYPYGSPAVFTFNLWNNTDKDRQIKTTWGLPHHYQWEFYNTFNNTVTVPAKSSTSFTYTLDAVTDLDRLRAIFYDENQRRVGYAEKGIWMVHPSVEVSGKTDKAQYAKAESIHVTASLRNLRSAPYHVVLRASVSDPANNGIYNESFDIALSANGTTSQQLNFNLPAVATPGMYTITLEAFNGSTKIGRGAVSFEVPRTIVSVTPTLPPALQSGAALISFVLTNKGVADATAGVLDVSLTGPDGATVFSTSMPFALASGATLTLDVPVTIPDPVFGNYSLTFRQSDETKTGNPTSIAIPAAATLAATLDKPSYRIRETANMIVDAANTGKFNLAGAALTVSIPELNFADTRPISALPGASTKSTFAIPIPDGMWPGQYTAGIALTLASGSTVTHEAFITIPWPALTANYSGPSNLKPGDEVSITIENTGGVDSDMTGYIELVKTVPSLYLTDIADIIPAGGNKAYTFTIPAQTVTGDYQLYVDAYEPLTNSWGSLYRELSISGLSATLSVKTDKDIYLDTDNITAMSSLANHAYDIANGNLHLQIVSDCPASDTGYFYISTWDGEQWVERGSLLYGPALDTQLFDLSQYLPDANGEYKVRVREQSSSYWNDYAEIDYVALRSGGADYQLSTAHELLYGWDISEEIGYNDGYTTWVANREVEVSWSEFPVGAVPVLVMKAQAGRPWYGESCSLTSYWDTDIPVDQAANTVVDLSTIAGSMPPGQYHLRGTLRAQTNTVIAQAEYPFSVVGGDFGAVISTDKAYYRPGETITVTGTVYNLTDIDAIGVTINGWGYNAYYNETIDIPAKGSRVFTFTEIAPDYLWEGIYEAAVYLEQNYYWLGDARTYARVATSEPYYSLYAPEAVGNEKFDINVFLDNYDGTVPSTVTIKAYGGSLDDTRTITLQPGEYRTVQYSQSITADTTYTVEFTGDVEDVLETTVIYGLSAEVSVEPDVLYPEGKVAVPVTVYNTGWFEELITVDYQLMQGAAIISSETRTYYVSGDSLPDILYFDLPEGDYQLTANSPLQAASTEAQFSVRKAVNVQMNASLGAQSGGLFPLTAEVSNLGLNAFDGSVEVSVLDSQGSPAWDSAQTVSQLAYLTRTSVAFTIDPASMAPNNYTVRVRLYDNANQQLAEQNLLLQIQGAAFQITKLPDYQTIASGQTGTLVFMVKNVGSKEGAASLQVKAYDLLDSTQQQWLSPGEEKEMTFEFQAPDDLEEKDYFADYQLTDDQGKTTATGQVKYHLAGINIGVTAALDKQNYSAGDTARLVLTIADNRTQKTDVNLFARVQYNGYEEQQPFILNGTVNLTFNVPLTEITGEKLFYGIYHESGRSIHLNSLYVYAAGDALTITTDKQVYDPGQSISALIQAQESGNQGKMTVTWPGGYEETFDFSGSAARSYTLPSTMTAGTYNINAQLSSSGTATLSSSRQVDVNGIQVKITEAALDKSKYAATDTLHLDLTVTSNTDLAGTLKTWVVDPQGNRTAAGERSVSLSSSAPLLIEQNSQLVTSVSGQHRLVYNIYSGDTMLVSGAESFDVGDAALLSVATDKTSYSYPAEAAAALKMYGTANATIELFLDGVSVMNAPVTLSGFSDLSSTLGSLQPGTHTAKGVLSVAGLTSTREATFTVVQTDTTPPVTVLSAGSPKYETTQKTYVTGGSIFTLSASDDSSGVDRTEYRIDGGTWTTAISFTIAIEGNHTIEYQSQDKAGNLEKTKTLTVFVDKSAPSGSIAINGGSATTNQTQANLALACSDSGSGCALMKLSVDGNTWPETEAYSAAKTWTLASGDGTKTVYVKFVDNLGMESTAVNASISLDTAAPDTAITSGPQALANSASASFGLASTKAESTFQCRLDQGSFSACTSPVSYNGIIDGDHTFVVRAVDKAGNADQTPASFAWTIDTIPPMAEIIGLPGGPVASTTAALTIAGSGVTAYRYRLDSGTFSADTDVAAPITLTGLTDGSYMIFVTAVDKAGNWQSEDNATTGVLIIDNQQPALSLSTLPDGAYTNNATLNIAGTANDAWGLLSLTVNDGATPVGADGAFSLALMLGEGANRVTVTATDFAGNKTSDVRTITFDPNAPQLMVTAPPDNSVTNQAEVTVVGTVDELSRVDVSMKDVVVASADAGGMFSLPVTLEYGVNTIVVTAIDLAANSSMEKRTITLDNINPALAVTNPAQDITTDQPGILLQGTVSDLTALTVTIAMDDAAYTPAVTSGVFEQQLTLTSAKTYAVSVTAVDAAGNTTTVQRNINYAPATTGLASIKYTGPTFLAQGKDATLSAELGLEAGSTSDVSGRTLTFVLNAGSVSQSCSGTTDNHGKASCTISDVKAAPGAAVVTASYSGDGKYQPVSESKNVIVFAYPSSGAFVISNKEATVNNHVTFWGSQWSKENNLGSSKAVLSFKGYADKTDASDAECKGSWQSSSGNSSHPPKEIPAYMAVLTSSTITKSGSTLSGDVKDIVIVKIDPGYDHDPGHSGTGIVLGSFCGQSGCGDKDHHDDEQHDGDSHHDDGKSNADDGHEHDD